MPTPHQPKIAQNLALRTLGLLLAVAAVLGGFRWLQSYSEDIGGRTAADTYGMVAAIERTDDGQRAVIFKPDGTILREPGYRKGDSDRDLAWPLDGNRLFFVKDREGEGANIYRWNPATNAPAERRSVGSRSRGNIVFGVDEENHASGLLTAGGFVVEYDPDNMATRQVLPPVPNEVVSGTSEEGEEGGAQGQFGPVYGRIGASFRQARWLKERRYIAAIMRRAGGDGEVLVIQAMQGNPQPPIPLAAGDRIEMDIIPTTGDLVFVVLGHQFIDPENIPPQYIKNKRPVPPFRHGMFIFDPSTGRPPATITASQDDPKAPAPPPALAAPAVSADGTAIAAVMGTFEDGSHRPSGLVALSLRPEDPRQITVLTQGEIYEPSWGPDGETIVFARRTPEGTRDIFTIAKDGTGERNLSGGRGNFASPRFSPQLPKKTGS